MMGGMKVKKRRNMSSGGFKRRGERKERGR